MSEFKGTPGPWVNVGGWVDSEKPGVLSSIICSIDAVAQRNPEHVNNANANLIAAAPELLEALQGIIKVADRDTDEFNKAKAAIAKALIAQEEKGDE